LLALCLLAPPAPAVAADGVTEWAELADVYGDGLANWRTLAIMHQAIHDALNAVLPTYQRWAPPADDEPSADGALPGAATAGAAAQVLRMLHPSRQDDTERLLQRALDRYVAGPALNAGVSLGESIGRAAVERRDNDGRSDIRPFASSTEPGRWAKTPQEFGGSNTTSTLPFLSSASEASRAPPPPALDGDVYRRGLDEVRRVGGAQSSERTDAQTQAAIFWAYQSSQRGYLHLAMHLLEERPQPGGPLDHARIMSQVTAALADSAILTWREKERFASWRPVTAIRTGSPGVTPDPDWLPFLETPPFPEYPSGHAADCYTGSAVLQRTFEDVGSVTYVAQASGESALDSLPVGMGQHGQLGYMVGRFERRLPSLDATAEECAESRIWAGAHFRPGLDEARRLGQLIATRAAAALPRIGAVPQPGPVRQQ
jgi:hypothetical protein